MITEKDIQQQCQHKQCCQFPKCGCAFVTTPTAEERDEYWKDEVAAGMDGDYHSTDNDDNGDDNKG